MRTIRLLDLTGSRRLMGHLLMVAFDDRLAPVSICIVDATGRQLRALAMDGAEPSTVQTARNKALTALNFERDTILFHHEERDGRWVKVDNKWSAGDLANAHAIHPDFVSWGGGVLVRSPHDGTVLGAVGVSGRTELQDHELASARPSGWAA